MSLPDYWSGFQTTGFVASSVIQVATMAANDHIIRVRLIGTLTFNPKPTNVMGDDGIFLGILATFPAAAPPAPTAANGNTWIHGWWGRPPITACEAVYWPPAGSLPAYRWHFDIDVPYQPDNGGSAGALYVGTQQMYVDANHATIDTSYTLSMWGYQS